MKSYLNIGAAALVAALSCGCPSDNNGVSPTKDVGGGGDTDAGITDDAGDMSSSDVTISDDVPTTPGSLVIEPMELTFSDVRQGQSETKTVTLSNVGGELLVISKLEIRELNRTGDPELVPGERFDTTMLLQPNTFTEVDITYAPNDFETDRGILDVWSTDPSQEMVEVRIETVNAYPDLQAPQFVRFGSVTVGESKVERVVVTNRGIDPLEIRDVALEGPSMDYRINFVGGAVPPLFVETGRTFEMDVTYSPRDAGTDNGRITLTTSDPDDESWAIALVGNEPTPCLRVQPDPIDFGELEAAGPQAMTVTLVNCSFTLPVEVTNIELTDDGGGAFALSGVPGLPLELGPAETGMLTATATLNAPRVAIGDVTIESTDETRSEQVELRAALPE